MVTVVCGVEERSPRSHACTYSFRRNALCLYGTFSVCAFSIVCAPSKCARVCVLQQRRSCSCPRMRNKVDHRCRRCNYFSRVSSVSLRCILRAFVRVRVFLRSRVSNCIVICISQDTACTHTLLFGQRVYTCAQTMPQLANIQHWLK